MDGIQPGTGISRHQRKIVLRRAKLLEQLRQKYIREGKSPEEAVELARALVQGSKFMRM